jgi:hypothetical protein
VDLLNRESIDQSSEMWFNGKVNKHSILLCITCLKFTQLICCVNLYMSIINISSSTLLNYGSTATVSEHIYLILNNFGA